MGKVYKLVHDFYELPNGKKEFISYIKKALETENEEKITHAKKPTNKTTHNFLVEKAKISHKEWMTTGRN